MSPPPGTKLQMTNREVMELHRIIQSFGDREFKESRKEKSNALTKFLHWMSRNLDKLERIVKSLEETRKPSAALREYDQKRLEVVHEFAERDKQGNPIHEVPNRIKIPEDKREEFDKEIGELKKKKRYADALKGYENALKSYEELLDGPVQEQPDVNGIELFYIWESMIPLELTINQRRALLCITREDEEKGEEK